MGIDGCTESGASARRSAMQSATSSLPSRCEGVSSRSLPPLEVGKDRASQDAGERRDVTGEDFVAAVAERAMSKDMERAGLRVLNHSRNGAFCLELTPTVDIYTQRAHDVRMTQETAHKKRARRIGRTTLSCVGLRRLSTREPRADAIAEGRSEMFARAETVRVVWIGVGRSGERRTLPSDEH